MPPPSYPSIPLAFPLGSLFYAHLSHLPPTPSSMPHPLWDLMPPPYPVLHA